MNYQKLIEKGLLKKEIISLNQISKILKKADKNLKSAKILLNNNLEENAFEMAYEAMLSAGRALVFLHGFRPKAQGSHKIVIEFSKIILGEKFGILIEKFDKMRKKRHYLIYGAGLAISKTETKNAIKTAVEFTKNVREIIKKRSPQLELF